VGRILIAVYNGPEVIPVCLALHRKSGRVTLRTPGKGLFVRPGSVIHGYRIRLEDICLCLMSARPSTLRTILAPNGTVPWRSGHSTLLYDVLDHVLHYVRRPYRLQAIQDLVGV
jgi:hypothetical protein